MSQDATTDTTTTNTANAPVPTPPPSAPAAQPAPEPTTDEPREDDDPNDTQLSKVRREAAANRIKAREANEAKAAAETERDSLKAILEGLNKVLNPDAAAGGTVDPAEQVATLTGTVDTLSNENVSLKAENAVLLHAPDLGGNSKALLDSVSFRETLKGLDHTADDYSAQVADAIKTAVAANASLRADQGSSRGGSAKAGQGAGDGIARPASLGDAIARRLGG